MNTIKTLLLTAALAMGLSSTFAQAPASGSIISGKVTDQSQKPLDYVTVSLVRATDSVSVKTAYSGKDGTFVLKGVAGGEYKVRLTQVGLSKYTSPLIRVGGGEKNVSLGTLILKSESRQLKEVQITASKPFIERQGDKLVVNVATSAVSAGSSALEVLQKAPGISLDKDDNIMLKGKQGVLVMIDGKPTYLSNADLASMLRNMQSNEIESLEIISNPSARYEAQGKSGIINIRLKKNKNYGTNGTLTAGGGYSGYRKSNAGLTLNNRNKKVNLFGNYNYNNNKGEHFTDIDRMNNSQGVLSNFLQNGKGERFWFNHSFKAGADYFISKNKTLGILVNGFFNQWNEDFRNSTFISSQQGVSDSTVRAGNISHSTYRNLSYNLNYKAVADSQGREFSIDLDYSNNYSNDKNSYDNNYYYTATNSARQELLNNEAPASIDIYAVKMDYTYPIAKGFKIEAGYKSSWVKTDNDFQATRFTDDQWVNDASRSNHFVYNENVHAAYVNFRREWKKLNLQAGVRAEQTNSKGNLVTTGEVVKRHYLDFFPSAAINYTHDENHAFGLTYSRRISRPQYDALNPFEYYLDKYTFMQGNPFLKPEYTNTFELSYTLKKKYTVSAGYNKTTDVITQVLLPDPARSALFQTNENLSEQVSWNLNVSAPVTFTKWWSSNNNVTLFNNQFNSPDLNGQVLDNNQTAVQFNSTQNFRINKDFSAEVSGNYQSRMIYGTFLIRPQYGVDLGFNKSMMNKRLNMKLAVNDIFKTRSGKIRSAYPGLDYQIDQNWDSRVARLTLSWKFGNNEVKPNRNRSTGLDAETGRLKN